jgi:hypothetical protein
MNAINTKTVKKVVNKTAKTTTKIVNVPTETKTEAVRYLSEGVTGKQMMQSIYKANNAHKVDLGTFSQCLKRAIEFGAVEMALVIKDFNINDMCAKNLIPLRNEKKTVADKWSVYEVLQLTKKFYKTK